MRTLNHDFNVLSSILWPVILDWTHNCTPSANLMQYSYAMPLKIGRKMQIQSALSVIHLYFPVFIAMLIILNLELWYYYKNVTAQCTGVAQFCMYIYS